MTAMSWTNSYCTSSWTLFENYFISPCFARTIDAIVPILFLSILAPLYVAKLSRVRQRFQCSMDVLHSTREYCRKFLLVGQSPESVPPPQRGSVNDAEVPYHSSHRTPLLGQCHDLSSDLPDMSAPKPSRGWYLATMVLMALSAVLSFLPLITHAAQSGWSHWRMPAYSFLIHSVAHFCFYLGMALVCYRRSITPLSLSINFNIHLYLVVALTLVSHTAYFTAVFREHPHNIWAFGSILGQISCLVLGTVLLSIHSASLWSHSRLVVFHLSTLIPPVVMRFAIWSMIKQHYQGRLQQLSTLHGLGDVPASSRPNNLHGSGGKDQIGLPDPVLPFVSNPPLPSPPVVTTAASPPPSSSASPGYDTHHLLSDLKQYSFELTRSVPSGALDSWLEFKKHVLYNYRDGGFSYFESDDVYMPPPHYTHLSGSLCPPQYGEESLVDVLKTVEHLQWASLRHHYNQHHQTSTIPIKGPHVPSSYDARLSTIDPEVFPASDDDLLAGDDMVAFLSTLFPHPPGSASRVAPHDYRTGFQREYLTAPPLSSSPMANLQWPWELTCSAFSTLTFGWITPLLRYGYSAIIEMDDLDWPAPYASTARLLAHFDFFWSQRLKTTDNKSDSPSSTNITGPPHPAVDTVLLSDIPVHHPQSTQHSPPSTTPSHDESSSPAVLPAVLEDLPGQRSSMYNATSMFHLYWQVTGRRVVYGSFCKLFGDVFGYFPPIIMNSLLLFASDPSSAPFWGGHRGMFGYMLGILLVLSNWTQSVLLQHSYHFMIREGARARSLTMAMIYRKLLTIDPLIRRAMGDGMINNILTTDSQRIDNVYWMGYYIIFAPIQCIVTVFLLVRFLGYSAFVGVGILLLTLPIQLLMSRVSSRLTAKNQNITDSRISSLIELLAGVRTVKSHAWEPDFLLLVSSIRRAECRALLIRQVWNGLQAMLLQSAPSFVATATFFTYAKTSHILTPATAFTALALFNMLQTTLWSMPWTVQYIVEFRVALVRLAAFLSLPDKQMMSCQYHYTCTPAPVPPHGIPTPPDHHDVSPSQHGNTHQPQTTEVQHDAKGTVCGVGYPIRFHPSSPQVHLTIEPFDQHAIPIGEIRVVNRDFWTSHFASPQSSYAHLHAPNGPLAIPLPALHIPRLVIPNGSFTCIVGPIGSGKSFLLSSILGNIPSTPSLLASMSPLLQLHLSKDAAPSDRAHVIDQLKGAPLVNPTTHPPFVNPFTQICIVPQLPWIISGTVRDNIILDAPFIPDLFQESVEACALLSDLDSMPHREMTVIGERGSTLSGGQKQRINICRAVYRRHLASVFVFDSPLSALDSHVAEHIYNRVLGPNGLLKHKTRVMVTHQLQWCVHADQILSMQSCPNMPPLHLPQQGVSIHYGSTSIRIAQMGSFDHLAGPLTPSRSDPSPHDDPSPEVNPLIACTIASYPPYQPFHDLYESHRTQALPILHTPSPSASTPDGMHNGSPIHTHTREGRAFTPPESHSHHPHSFMSVPDTIGSIPTPSSVASSASSLTSLTSSVGYQSSTVSFSPSEHSSAVGLISCTPDETTTDTSAASSEIVQSEHRAKGEVGWSVYLSYLSNIGVLLSICCLLVCLAQVGVARYTDFWLTQWSSNKLGRDAMFYIKIYSLLQLATVISNFIGGIIWAVAGVQASKMIHDSMLTSIVFTAMSFFDTTPLGRIMNRFNNDISSIDSTLPTSFSNWLSLYIQIFSYVIVMGIQMPTLLPVFIPLGIVFAYVSTYFRASCRELRRLEAISKSPIFVHLDQTIDGLGCIDVYRQHIQYLSRFFHVLDDHWRPRYLGQCLNRWLAFRLDFLGNIILLCVIVVSLTFGKSSSNDSSLLGLVLGYALTMTSKVNWLVRTSVDTENQMNSVDRCIEYSSLTPEAPGNPYQALDCHMVSYSTANPKLPSSKLILLLNPTSRKPISQMPEHWEQTRDIIDSTTRPIPSLLQNRPPITQSDTDRTYLFMAGIVPLGFRRPWPAHPSIAFHSAKARYRDGLPLVVNGISCNITAGQKVAVVGRTGAGKSSLVSLLLRLIETESALAQNRSMLDRVSSGALSTSFGSAPQSHARNQGGLSDSNPLHINDSSSHPEHTVPLLTNTSDAYGRSDSGSDSQSIRISAEGIHHHQFRCGIEIDGVDLATLPLSFLRQNLCIIPQDPVLFSQSMRFNLSPPFCSLSMWNTSTQAPFTSASAEYDEQRVPPSSSSSPSQSSTRSPQEMGITPSELLQHPIDGVFWNALDRVGLLPTVASLPGGLEYRLKSQTDVFSHGQRQLYCLARALLKGSSIILLDEATSSVDLATEQMMNNVIEECFDGCTIISIAHHLHPILDYDVVIVMEAGVIAEMGNPRVLLQSNTSLFSSLVLASTTDTGPEPPTTKCGHPHPK